MTELMGNIELQELEEVAGGASKKSSWRKGKVKGVKHYLALRTAPSYNDKNETGIKFHNGDSIQVKPGKVNGSYIKPNGYQYSSNDVTSKCKGGGTTCAKILMDNGWKFPKDYPW